MEGSVTRKVTFGIVCSRTRGMELSQRIGSAPDVTRQTDQDVVWELQAEGTGEDDLSSLIAQVLSRVHNLEEQISSVSTDPDVTTILRVVQYIGDDFIGPGFAIEAEHVALLARLNAVVDVDQYVR